MANSWDEREAWRTIAAHVGLSESELSDFVAHCDLAFGQPEPPGGGPDSLDWRHYRKQFDSLHKAIATWLTNNPDADFIEREYLLAAIGLRTSRAGLIQRFVTTAEVSFRAIPTDILHFPARVVATAADACQGEIEMSPVLAK